MRQSRGFTSGQASILDEIAYRLQEFETALEESSAKAAEIRNEVLNALREPFKPNTPSIDLPKKLVRIAQNASTALAKAEDDLRKGLSEFVRQEKLVDLFEDSFLLVMVGRVKQGKTTLCDCLAKVFEVCLSRGVERFRLDEPTRELSVREAVGQEIYAPYLHDHLKTKPSRAEREVWEKLKRNRFILTPDCAMTLEELGIERVSVPTEGDYKKSTVSEFEIDSLEVPKMQGFISGKLCVLDAPGLSSGNSFAQERAKNMWLASNMAVYLSSSDAPLQATDLRLLKEHASDQHRSILFVISKCDHYSEEEEDGIVKGRRYFDNEAFEKQAAFVRRVLQDEGLSCLLSEETILGLSCKLFKDGMEGRKGRLAIENAIDQGRFQEFLCRLSDALKREGLRRKITQPLQRAKRVAAETASELQKHYQELSLVEKGLASEQGLRENLVARFKELAFGRLERLLRERMAAAQALVSKDRSVPIEISPSDIRKVCASALQLAAKDYSEALGKAIEEARFRDVEDRLEERWKEVTESVRRKVGRSATGKTIGAWAGSVAGAILGLLVAGPLGGLAGALFGSGVGGAIGDLADEDEYVTVPTTRPVREGDNFAEVEQRLRQQLEQQIEQATSAVEKQMKLLLDSVAKLVKDARGELEERISRLHEIEGKADNLIACLHLEGGHHA